MIGKYFTNTAEVPTPLPMKIGLVITAWTPVSMVVRSGTKELTADPLAWAFTVSLALAILFVAVWNMKRWAVVALLVFSAWNVYWGVAIGARWWFVASFRLIPLLPVAFYWRRMAWV